MSGKPSRERRRPTPVSYTHLDVYKRQTLDRAAREFGARAIVVTRPRDGATAQAKGLEALGYRRHELYGQAAGLDTDILIR